VICLFVVSGSGCRGGIPLTDVAPTDNANPGTAASPSSIFTPTRPAIRSAVSPTATQPSANPTPTPPPVAPKEGYTAPDFSLPDVQGNPFTLNQFHGWPVLINFWTTWCPYCVEEMHALQSTYQRYSDRGLVVLTVNVQEDAEKVILFAQEQGLTFPILLDSDASVTMTYTGGVIPTTFFINRQGVVTAIHLGPLTEDDIDTYLTDLFYGGE
jgi:peroxiredoxin